ncbi:MAG: signal peptidase I [Candidatus Thiodiazotropha endolucinida]|nr:signal peptidase I [Candidatus Thiodiazotropha taylori]MCW4249648.1 signal peptidase I [Candidatus Thiodiazotropha endolucinida]MCG7883036.1 signal peptidase I [Candidatus Thiodiazotropha taylori]MCG8058678.1 signal peptidase I [Candidatus Thiodiazotropha taylori]MCG8104616.1 signal peptidase I [Candidatus Thiodiazotropha taylori]
MTQAINPASESTGASSESSTGINRFIKKKESWTKFSIKATVVLTVMVLAGMAFASRYSIVGDPQEVRCIPDYTVYLVDKKDTELKRGQLYMFLSKDLSPIYEEGTEMLKYLRAVPGDEVEIRDNDQIFINGEASEWGLGLAQEKLGQPSSNFHGKTKLGDDQYWFLGTSPKSFDSRYWGAVKRENIIGRAYPLF